METMARPRLGESERRRRTIGVRVTEAEETELRERAQAACLSMEPTYAAGRWVSGCGWRQSCGWGQRSYGS